MGIDVFPFLLLFEFLDQPIEAASCGAYGRKIDPTLDETAGSRVKSRARAVTRHPTVLGRREVSYRATAFPEPTDCTKVHGTLEQLNQRRNFRSIERAGVHPRPHAPLMRVAVPVPQPGLPIFAERSATVPGDCIATGMCSGIWSRGPRRNRSHSGMRSTSRFTAAPLPCAGSPINCSTKLNRATYLQRTRSSIG